MLLWQGAEAELEPWPGGVFRMNVRGDGFASGRFTEIDPPRRIVFTWGWEQPDSAVPAGSSVVEVELLAKDGGTLVRLTHRDLPAGQGSVHALGWNHYADRLVVVAEGGDPGPDPLRV